MLTLMRFTVCTGDAGGGRSVCTGEEEHKVCIICLHCLYYMFALVKKNTKCALYICTVCTGDAGGGRSEGLKAAR